MGFPQALIKSLGDFQAPSSKGLESSEAFLERSIEG